MKIKKIAKHQNQLVKLKLIKTKTYKKNDHNFIKIEDTVSRLKKALHIIYNYDTSNKRILFVGTPLHIDEKLKNLIKNTKHTYTPESVWMNGILTNQHSCFKYLSKNQQSINRKISTTLFETGEKSDLIVILDSSRNLNALNEGYLTRTPLISLNSNNSDTKSSYTVPGNFKFTNKKIKNNFFYSVLNATLRKAQINYELKKRKKNMIKKSPVKFEKVFKK